MVAVVNSNRAMMGVSDAMDWPPKDVKMEGFYLLTLGEKPLIGKSFWSPTIPVVVHLVQWTWIVRGTDLIAGKIGRSRGDRYRTNMTMRQELLKATYPWWTEKLDWTVQGTTPSGLSLIGASRTPKEYIWWTPPTFLNRGDRDAGVLYGAASVQITDMTDVIPSPP